MTEDTIPTGADPQLWQLVEIWRQAASDVVELLGELPESEWGAATDLPGWDVKAVASHCAHIESSTLGRTEPTVDIGEPAHVTNAMGRSTETGVVNRRDLMPAEIIAELRGAVEERYAALRSDPPADPSAPATGHFGSALGWDMRTLLRNRPFDLWMHEQDIRRAVCRPGHLHSGPGDHVTSYLRGSLGMVLVKRAGGGPGQSLVLVVDDHPTAVQIEDDGRARPTRGIPSDPTVTLRTDRESFVRLAGGRGEVAPDRVVIEGDQDLGRRVVAGMNVVP
ncbi:maleylpyruvate isomerase family mycothiol-dependent enzyme [Nocardioides insulae]|uniref:maleylpyruvate isomerase family mycothiol-dependent enzyme n=1 Tax=Nocardioides insulae TaxID=394734 RepID=UPI00040269C6|nr:maleylpyruvate isomerase family mycothiol-dependent enzyme [Nocardioides insulae]